MDKVYKTDEETRRKNRERVNRWNAANRERVRERKRKRHLEHLEEDRAYAREAARRWRVEHPEKVAAVNFAWRLANAEQQKKYYQDNRERRNKQHQIWTEKNREKVRETKKNYLRKCRETDPAFKILSAFRNRLNNALGRSGSPKFARTVELLGCSIDDFQEHLAAQFKPGMTFENHGEWHIDHIIPCAAFDLTDPAQQRACFHYSNLQPLWAVDNLHKGARLPGLERMTG